MRRREDIERFLVEDLSGSELTSVMLDVMHDRARAVTPAAVLARLENDRFVRTSSVSPATVRHVEQVIASVFPAGTDEVELAPLVPFGAHAAVAGVDQNRVVSTIRGSEVAADPTLVLAMEAARRRKAHLAADPKSADMVSLAAFQRVTRAQTFDSSGSFAHFELSALVTAGRDTGNERFERAALDLHVGHAVDGLRRLGCERIEVLVSDFTRGRLTNVVDDVSTRWSDPPHVVVEPFPDRTRARGYYTDLAIEVHAVIGGKRWEVGDGGSTDWTQKLVASRKERVFISGLGVERLALALG